MRVLVLARPAPLPGTSAGALPDLCPFVSDIVHEQVNLPPAIAEGTANTGAVTVVDELQFPEAPLFVNDRQKNGSGS
jgi:hypothetical protein